MDGNVEASQHGDGTLRIDGPEYARFFQELLAECKAEEYDEPPKNNDSVDSDDRMWTGYVSDSDVFIAGKKIEPRQWRYYYDTGLCARLGLYCYNYQKGTAYDFRFVSRLYTREIEDSFTQSFITVEAVNPADRSRLTLETCLKHNDELVDVGGSLWWQTYICRVEGNEEADYEWDDEAISDHYKGEMPKWFSDDDIQRCYVVGDSELRDKKNRWLSLFTEVAFYTKWNGTLQVQDIAQFSHWMPDGVVVETRGEPETEPRDKLKAANAIFYISFECAEDPETGKLGHYRAVVRKTMDGKPGHMRLEVKCWCI